MKIVFEVIESFDKVPECPCDRCARAVVKHDGGEHMGQWEFNWLECPV